MTKKKKKKKTKKFYKILLTHISGTAWGILLNLKRGILFMEANPTVNLVPFG